MRIKIDKNSRSGNYRNYEDNRRKPDSKFHRAREREMLYRLGVTGCCSRVALSEMLRGISDSFACAALLPSRMMNHSQFSSKPKRTRYQFTTALNLYFSI